MDLRKRLKDSEVIGLSITELFLLIIFVFLLVISTYYQKKTEAEKLYTNLETTKEEDREVFEEVKEAYFSSDNWAGDKGSEDGVDSISSLVEQRREIIKNFYEELKKPGVKEFLEKQKLPPNWTRLESIYNKAMKYEVLEAALGEEGSEIFKLAEGIVDLKRLPERDEQAITDLTDRFGFYLRKPGLDRPPCWSNQNEKTEYMYDMVILEEGFLVESVWASGRDKQALAIGAPAFPHEKQFVGLGEFREVFGAIDTWSRNISDPPCAFFVNVYRGTETVSLEKWLRAERMLESIFYKLKKY